ncbi:sulfite exporter TauE/SafE family protein [Nonomuraea cypriaca]|uniref:sulfite exporter TauE/SafE family protein n=1 Tax=Nonomuraea cypriaca TaxID=1187855 RepID=UPI001A9C4D1B|nr:sulfite exporter TauE/SafE family protein [Nonomuraea cypriaca]
MAGTASCAAAQGGLLVGLADHCHGRDPVLVGWFLAGRLASYTMVGALLGLAGSAVSLPPAARAVLLVAAGLTMIVFAVRLMRRGRAACAPHEPAAPSRYKAPLLGAATILVPCGVTLGVEMLAVSSGSPLAGAAAMAGFVIGTAPAFALLGYVLRRVSRTRLAGLAGIAAIAAGLWTVASGVNLGGWLPDSPPAAAGPVSPTVTVWATREGYRPAVVAAPAGVPVQVVFKLVDRGCTGTVTIDGRDVALPATVQLPPQRPGSLRYVCGMGMYAGFIDFS